MQNKFSKLLFSIKTKILSPKIVGLYQKSNENLIQRDLDGLNFKKRQELFKHAIKYSDFYKKKYAHLDFSNIELATNDDFLKIPPLTRDELRLNFEDIKSSNVNLNKCRKASTSGSTGPSVSVLHDKRHPETPIRWRILNWWGIEPWENQAFIYRFKKPLWERIANSIMWWPTKRVFLAAANPSSKQLATFVKTFNKIKPTLLQGYVDVVFEFALYLLDNKIKIHPPKMVWVTSAPLFEEQRQLMEKAFGAPVCDQYGNTEIMLIAAECPEQNGLHIMQDTVHIEFVDANNQPVPANTSGKVLLTDLTNFAFPLIRYEIGDEGKYLDRKCACGRSLPLMDNIKGRQSKQIVTPSGLQIKGEHLMAMFDGHMKLFREIQLQQQQDYSVCIFYVPRKAEKTGVEIDAMVHLLKQRARFEITVRHEKVEHVTRVGKKSPFIISDL
ncbi:phenylacetate-CoA ligase [Maribacter spongiicola]|uniref:Phenylacetate-CoA ligase n=1 Tax=Maribacter spongiicola TaxID=1206753 RepID=A0A4R7K6R5_9FLAO|nr:phenylacetate-CoA ligase [Maribacter spongiicola]